MQRRIGMRTLETMMAVLSLGLVTMGCGEQGGMKIGDAGGVKQCSLSLDGLDGTEWILLRINPDRTETPDPAARMKFFTEDGELKVKYNVGSVSSMYTYDCKKNAAGVELHCKEPPQVQDWCQALITGGAECTPESLKKIDSSLTDDEIEKGIEAAEKTVAKYKGTKDWDAFVFNNNNLGNKLQGLLYVKVDKRKCRLRVTDDYMTIYNGKRVEDSNPVGTNPFVKNDQGELLWENCTDSQNLRALAPGSKVPRDIRKIEHIARQPVGKPVDFWYVAPGAQTPKEGCTDSVDWWLNGKPLQKNWKPKEENGKLVWHFQHTFDAPSTTANGEVLTMVRHTACQGKKPETDVACAAVLIR